ncbi:MAG: hypothetical protein JXR76_07395 [Deltaproteobacteria bacterium]|nr:hypothetical protein [Deltaproteobacteria bacterium]
MKNILTALFLLLPLRVQADDLWSMKELSVLAFDRDLVTVLEDEDGFGIRMLFNEWTPQIEAQIQSTVATSDMQYQLLPNRQARMTVELFSSNASLKFNTKVQRRTVQIIIGNSRPELRALNVLMDPDSLTPLPQSVVERIQVGDIAGARKELYTMEAQTPAEKALILNRINVADAALRDSVAAECNPDPAFFEKKEQVESAFLVSWCWFSRGNLEKANKVLDRLDGYLAEFPSIKKEYIGIEERISQHRRRIIVFTLLNFERQNDTPQLTNMFAKFANSILGQLFSVNILEIVASNLIRLGLGSMLTGYSDKILARLGNEELQQSAPVIAETYLNAEQYVRAQDAASFFLQKKLPDWARGRLLKVRAQVHLQEGNWRAAVSDFEQAKQLISFKPSDEVSVMEAYVRAEQTAQTKYIPPQGDPTPVDRFYMRLAKRLKAESRLRQGKTISDDEMATLPDHALYFAMRTAVESNQDALANRIQSVLNQREGSWATLATTETEIKQMAMQLKKLRKAW